MAFIDFDVLEAFGPEEFQNADIYPHAVWEGVLFPNAFEALVDSMPDISTFHENFGQSRRAGQKPHDRHSLEYTSEVELSDPWRGFIDELRGDRYRRHIARLFGARKVEFRFHWHLTSPGCSVSPHCDARREWGSHLFYFNSRKTWKPEWGGHTVLLDDGGRFDYNSAPEFEDFDRSHTIECVGNVSALLARSDRGWHGVREIDCPEGEFRKVFIVVVNPDSRLWRARDWLIGKTKQRF